MIRAEFSAQMCRDHTSLPAWRNFDTFEALRDFIKPYAFAHTYRMRTHQNEHGRVTSREFLAVADDGREFYLGDLVISS